LTFRRAADRARERQGELILRIEDLDAPRCKPEYIDAAIEDLQWLGLSWTEGPVFQSQRRPLYLAAWRKLRDGGFIYPCPRSRRDLEAVTAPHEEEPLFPPELRTSATEALRWEEPTGSNWRFQVPDGEIVRFEDGCRGEVARTAGCDFGDFLIWNRDDVPAYELAVVVDDAAMGVTEAVRGADLLTSTCRQLLLYRALGEAPPAFYHCPLVVDAQGRRLAKRDAALTLRTLRAQGLSPGQVLSQAEGRLATSQ